MLELTTQSCEKTEEEIIEEIITNADYGSDAVCCWANLNYGRKQLEVSLLFPKKQMATHLKNIKNERYYKRPNETTILYKAAALIMQNWADCRNEELAYNTSTDYTHLVDWCRTKANAIFNWEKEEIDGTSHLFHTRFEPLLKDL